MDYAHPQNVAVYGDHERQYQQGEEDEEYEEGNPGEHEYYSERGHGGGGIGGSDMMGPMDSLDDSTIAGNNLKHSDDSSAGKLFVGGIAWETTEETFGRYFGKYGEITDSVIMMDKISGRPRGFGFVTFADVEVANKVLEEEHVIDGRAVEVKRTVPREDMQTRGVSRTKKIFVGGIPVSLTEADLKEYFSAYGNIVEHQIMLDHTTGRSRGFGFVTFDSEDAVEKIFSDGQMHELGGKRVEIKRAEPKRPGVDHGTDNRKRRGGGVGGGSSKSYGGYSGGAESFGGGFGGKMGRGYGAAAYGGYSGYGAYGGNYGGNFGGGAAGLYGYGGYGYGYGFGNPMYGGAAGYGAGSYGTPGNYGGFAGYGGGRGYGRGYDAAKGYGGSGGAAGYSGGKGYVGSIGGGGGGGGGAGAGAGSGGAYGSKGYGNPGASNGRFHPYRK